MYRAEELISKCIELAKKGEGFVSPNPLVGCILIKDGKIIGKGYHKKSGEPHAEVNAINNAKKNGHSPENAELFVNLEPCSHFGKTPPCADLIISEKIKSVYIGMTDPNPSVNGAGIKKLIEAGIEVKSGILEMECSELNKFFIKYIRTRLPYVTLKIAQTLDGRINHINQKNIRISSEKSQAFVHKLRSVYDAVLVGRNTAVTDNPSLTVRDVKGRNPLRFVIDRNLALPDSLRLYSDENSGKTFTFASSKVSSEANNGKNIIFLEETDDKFRIRDILNSMANMNVSSLLVEGGADIFSAFYTADLFDEIIFIIAPVIFGAGLSSFNHSVMEKDINADKLVLSGTAISDNDLILTYIR